MKFFLDLGYYFIFSKTNREDVNKKKEEKEKENQARNYRSFFVKELLLRHRRTAVGAFRVFLITNKQTKTIWCQRNFSKGKEGGG